MKFSRLSQKMKRKINKRKFKQKQQQKTLKEPEKKPTTIKQKTSLLYSCNNVTAKSIIISHQIDIFNKS